MSNRIIKRAAPGIDRAKKLVIVFFLSILILVFIWLAYTQGEFLFAFAGLIGLSVLVWMFYHIYKQPTR